MRVCTTAFSLSLLLLLCALGDRPASAQVRLHKGPHDTLEFTRKIHVELLAKAKAAGDPEQLESYAGIIPLTGVGYEMVAIPGGDFVMGSPETEADRKDEEGPQVGVRVSPFWMGAREVSWDEYEPFMMTKVGRNQNGSRIQLPDDPSLVELLSQPTSPYLQMDFEMGWDGFPAICMTQHAASKYCQWLSLQTGHFYRLPTEAEWEYACRAGTRTAYHFGDDPAALDAYAWHFRNSDYAYRKVGTKKPNPWGLYDMHGNVSEWVLDQFVPYDEHEGRADGIANPLRWATILYPRVVRGGSWDDDPDRLRSAARTGSHPDWKIQDPCLPKSPWFHTDAVTVGFRIVRSPEIPSAEDLHRIWNSGGIPEIE